MKWEGIITALATPFWKGEVDEFSLIKLLHNQLEQKISGFVVNGTTGESPCLSPKEVERIFSLVQTESKGQAKVILGVGGSSTAQTKHNIQLGQKWKADAVLAVVPPYNKPPQRGLVQHFTTLAQKSQVPIILYNVPARTMVGLSLESIQQLSLQNQILGIKEATGDLTFGKQVIQNTPAPFKIFSGDDISCIKLCAGGADGGICVISHILGSQMQNLFRQVKKENHLTVNQAVEKYHTKYNSLLKILYSETNPIGIKTALQLMGLFRSNEMRSPLVALEKTSAEMLKKQMQTLGLL